MAGASTRSAAVRQGVRLEIATVAWMSAEAAVAIAAGVAARSVLLTAFGADSLIELLSGAVLLWRLRVEATGRDAASIATAEAWASRASAALLVLLSAYVVFVSAAGLWLHAVPDHSWPGVAVSALALLVMPWLARRKQALNRTLNSPALRADIAESVTCAYLAGVTLAGLALDALTGWWWIQYLAAVLLLRWLIPEAIEALEAAAASRRAGARIGSEREQIAIDE